MRGWRLLRWLRGAQDTPAPRDAGLLGRDRLSHRAQPARPRAHGRGRAPAPGAVPRRHGSVAERRPAARRRRPDRVVQLARRRSLRPRSAARPAPARHQPDPLAGVRRLPAGRPVRRARHLPSAARPGHAAGDDPALRRRPQARPVAGPDRARARRGDAARFRRQRLARDPHAADRAVGLPRDPAQPAARPSRSRSA